MRPVITVKVQRPLMSNDPNVGYLVYDQGRCHKVEQVIPALAQKALGRDLKGYFQAQWMPKSAAWKIGERVEDRSW